MTPCCVGTINIVKTWTSFRWSWATGMAQQEPSETQNQQMQSPASRKQMPLRAAEAGTVWGAALGPGEQWAVSEPVPWMQRRPRAYPISKSMANRSRKVIISSILHSLDCILITAPSSDLLRQEKHEQTYLVQAQGKDTRMPGRQSSQALSWREETETEGCSAWRRGSFRGMQQQAAPTYKDVSEMTLRLFARVNVVEGWEKTDMSWNKCKLNIMKKISTWG